MVFGHEVRGPTAVLADNDDLLPLVNNPFQARFAGPYPVLKCLSGQNYLLKTPERRKGVQVCHINLLNPYFPPTSSVGLVTTVLDDSSHLSGKGTSSPKSSSFDCIGDDCVNLPSRGIIEGRLNNSEMYAKLVHHLPHLSQSEKSDILQLVVFSKLVF